jgi:hypothetical protein
MKNIEFYIKTLIKTLASLTIVIASFYFSNQLIQGYVATLNPFIGGAVPTIIALLFVISIGIISFVILLKSLRDFKC